MQNSIPVTDDWTDTQHRITADQIFTAKSVGRDRAEIRWREDDPEPSPYRLSRTLRCGRVDVDQIFQALGWPDKIRRRERSRPRRRRTVH